MVKFPSITDEIAQERWPDGFNLRDEANAIAAYAFRNGPIEDLHAGRASELLTNSTLSRITDSEMKQIMIYASERIEMLLRLKEESADEYTKLVKGYNWMYCNDWQR